MVTVTNAVETSEISYQRQFYKVFFGKDWEDIINMNRNTDGYTKNIFFEHKEDIDVTGTYLPLSQAVLYLVKFNMEGVPIPAKICLVSQKTETIFIYDTKDYIDYIENIKQYGSLLPSHGIQGFVEKKPPLKISYHIDSLADSEDAAVFFKSTVGNVRVHITEDNVYGWSRYFYDNSIQKEAKKDKFFAELRNPKSVLKDLIYPWNGDNKDFSLIMHLLNDPSTQKKLGAYYSPLAYCEKAAELVTKAIEKIPKDKYDDYVVIDRCAGTGNLEFALSDEQLKHVIISTYELQEWIALKNRIGKSVRYIIPPIPKNPGELPPKNKYGFLSGANALSKEFIDNEYIKQFVDNPRCAIILLENPPYRDSSASDKESADERDDKDLNVVSYVYGEMQKHLSEFDNSNISTARDVINQFIWSAFEYYITGPDDSYVLFCPPKCYKSLGMLNHEFCNGYLFNREFFDAASAGILCGLWSKNKVDNKNIEVEAYSIKNGKAIFETNVTISKVKDSFEKYFDRRKLEDDIETNVYCETDGTETSGRKCDGKSYYNDNIIAYCRTINYPIAAMNRYFTRQILYGARGFYIRKDNYLNMLPLFVAKCYPLDNWYDKDVLMTSSDGGTEYQEDKDAFLKYCLIFTCLTSMNKCVSFNGSDERYYKNELCFDVDTLASSELQNFKLTDREQNLIDMFNAILDEIKRKDEDGNYIYEEYNPEFSYGIYQIMSQIDIKVPKLDEQGNIVYEEGKNGNKTCIMVKKYGKNISNLIAPLKDALKQYYIDFIADKMLKYELVK